MFRCGALQKARKFSLERCWSTLLRSQRGRFVTDEAFQRQLLVRTERTFSVVVGPCLVLRSEENYAQRYQRRDRYWHLPSRAPNRRTCAEASATRKQPHGLIVGQRWPCRATVGEQPTLVYVLHCARSTASARVVAFVITRYDNPYAKQTEHQQCVEICAQRSDQMVLHAKTSRVVKV